MSWLVTFERRLIPTGTSFFSYFLIMRPATSWPTWLCFLIHFILYSIQTLHQLDIEFILLLLGFHKPLIIIFIDLNIFLKTFNGINQVHSLFLSFSIPIWVCTFITHIDIHPSYLIFMDLSPLFIFHPSEMYVDHVLI